MCVCVCLCARLCVSGRALPAMPSDGSKAQSINGAEQLLDLQFVLDMCMLIAILSILCLFGALLASSVYGCCVWGQTSKLKEQIKALENRLAEAEVCNGKAQSHQIGLRCLSRSNNEAAHEKGSSEDIEIVVHVTPYGRHYHKRECPWLRKSAALLPKSLVQALQEGYKLCHTCHATTAAKSHGKK